MRKYEKGIETSLIFLLSKITGFIPTSSPSSFKLVFWKILVSLLIMVNFFLLSINIFFLNLREASIIHEIIFKVSIFCFFIDMLVKLSTGFYDNGLVVTDRKIIVKRYFQTALIPDSIAIFTLINEAIYLSGQGIDGTIRKILEVFFILKLLDIRDTLTQYQQIFSLNETYQAVYSLIMLSGVLLLVAHTFACFWILIGVYSDSKYESSWVNSYSDFTKLSWENKYIISLYWSLTTVLTVGYGDITPKNPLEMIFTVVIMSFGCVVYGFLINQVGNILDKFNYSRKMIK